MVLDMAVKFIFNAVKSDLATQGRGLSEGVTDAVTQGAALRCAVLVMEKLSRSLMLATAVLIGLYKLVHNRSWLRSLAHSWRCCLPPALMAALAVAKQSPVLLAIAAVLSAPRRQQQPSRQVALDISTSNPVSTGSAVYSLVPVLYMSVLSTLCITIPANHPTTPPRYDVHCSHTLEWVSQQMRITYLGHAGLLVRTADCCVLCDPWDSANTVFFDAWSPYPANDHLDWTDIRAAATVLYISHNHR